MKKHLLSLSCAICLLVLASCSMVTSLQPVGIEPLKLVAAEWDGTWINSEGTVNLQVQDAEKGVFQMAWTEFKNGAYVMENYTLQVFSGKNYQFLNLLSGSDIKDIEGYLWGRMKKEGNVFLIWLPNYDSFKQAILDGKVTTKAMETNDDSSTLVLTDSAQRIVELAESEGSLYFEWDKPIVLMKLK